MNNRKWTIFVDVVTVVWLIVFTSSFFVRSEAVQRHCDLIMLLILPVFMADLVHLYREEVNFKSFIKKRWFDIVLVIPYLRIFRILRIARLMRVAKIIKLKRILGLLRHFKKSKRVFKAVKGRG